MGILMASKDYGTYFNLSQNMFHHLQTGVCKPRNKETRNETKRNETKRNETEYLHFKEMWLGKKTSYKQIIQGLYA